MPEPTDSLHKLQDEFSELTDALPFFRTALLAYRRFRTARIRWFLQGLDATRRALPENEQKRFSAYIASSEGQALLAQYADAVLRTSSRISIAALAIIFASTSQYTPNFRALATSALDGLTDSAAIAHVRLSLLKRCICANEPYPVCIVGASTLSSDRQLQAVVASPTEFYGVVYDLIRRGMLLPDHSSSRVGGNEWTITFGVSPHTDVFRDLLQRSQSYLGESTI